MCSEKPSSLNRPKVHAGQSAQRSCNTWQCVQGWGEAEHHAKGCRM